MGLHKLMARLCVQPLKNGTFLIYKWIEKTKCFDLSDINSNLKMIPAWEASSFGKDFAFPRGRTHRFLGKNLSEPCRGAENLRWDILFGFFGPWSKIESL